MSEILFDIVFKGRISRDIDQSKAIQNFAKIFKQDPAKAELFFDGKPRVLKKSMPMDKANHIRGALKKAGLKVNLKKVEALQQNQPEDVPQNQQAHLDTSSFSLSEVGVQFAKKSIIESPTFDLDDLILDEVGSQMAKKQVVEAQEFDVSHLQASEITDSLEDKKKIAPPQYDFENIQLNEVGSKMSEKKHIPPPQFDIDQIQLKD